MNVPMNGRKAEAARNDGRILAAARTVFLADPSAPVSAVAKEAGVGIAALYRRYPSKDVMLQSLAADGLHRYNEVAEAAAADTGDPWEAFVTFLERLVDADTSSLAQRLAGRFPPTEELHTESRRAQAYNEQIFERVAGLVPSGMVVNDIAVILEMVTALRLGTPERTAELRHRYLALVIRGLRDPDREPLPGTAPTWQELSERWSPATGS